MLECSECDSLNSFCTQNVETKAMKSSGGSQYAGHHMQYIRDSSVCLCCAVQTFHGHQAVLTDPMSLYLRVVHIDTLHLRFTSLS